MRSAPSSFRSSESEPVLSATLSCRVRAPELRRTEITLRRLALLALSAIAAAQPCAAQIILSPGPARPSDRPEQAGSPPGPTAATTVDDTYHLSAGDRVRVGVFGEPALSGEFDVSVAGTLALPLVGEVKALGLTPSELEKAIAAAYADGYLRNPRVSTEVLRYRPFYILGEVNKPGEYPYSSGLTVMNAVATANGFTYRADTHHVFIRHPGAATEQRLDLKSATVVEPGDTIRIKERYF